MIGSILYAACFSFSFCAVITTFGKEMLIRLTVRSLCFILYLQVTDDVQFAT